MKHNIIKKGPGDYFLQSEDGTLDKKFESIKELEDIIYEADNAGKINAKEHFELASKFTKDRQMLQTMKDYSLILQTKEIIDDYLLSLQYIAEAEESEHKVILKMCVCGNHGWIITEKTNNPFNSKVSAKRVLLRLVKEEEIKPEAVQAISLEIDEKDSLPFDKPSLIDLLKKLLSISSTEGNATQKPN